MAVVPPMSWRQASEADSVDELDILTPHEQASFRRAQPTRFSASAAVHDGRVSTSPRLTAEDDGAMRTSVPESEDGSSSSRDTEDADGTSAQSAAMNAPSIGDSEDAEEAISGADLIDSVRQIQPSPRTPRGQQRGGTSASASRRMGTPSPSTGAAARTMRPGRRLRSVGQSASSRGPARQERAAVLDDEGSGQASAIASDSGGDDPADEDRAPPRVATPPTLNKGKGRLVAPRISDSEEREEIETPQGVEGTRSATTSSSRARPVQSHAQRQDRGDVQSPHFSPKSSEHTPERLMITGEGEPRGLLGRTPSPVNGIATHGRPLESVSDSGMGDVSDLHAAQPHVRPDGVVGMAGARGPTDVAADSSADRPFVVFQCSSCKTILGDSLAWIEAQHELRVVVLACVTEVVQIDEGLHTSLDGGLDVGSTYATISCASPCGAPLGRVYRTTPRDLDELRDAYSFHVDSLSVYQLGSGTRSAGLPLPTNELFDEGFEARLHESQQQHLSVPGQLAHPDELAAMERRVYGEEEAEGAIRPPPASASLSMSESRKMRILIMAMGERLLRLEEAVASLTGDSRPMGYVGDDDAMGSKSGTTHARTAAGSRQQEDPDFYHDGASLGDGQGSGGEASTLGETPSAADTPTATSSAAAAAAAAVAAAMAARRRMPPPALPPHVQPGKRWAAGAPSAAAGAAAMLGPRRGSGARLPYASFSEASHSSPVAAAAAAALRGRKRAAPGYPPSSSSSHGMQLSTAPSMRRGPLAR